MTTDIVADVGKTRVSPSAFIVDLIFCVLLVVVLTVLVFTKNGPPSKIELSGRINPNDAAAVSLARLPGIGVGRAQAIVTYRQDFNSKGGQGPAFADCNDLRKVKGLGPATVKKIGSWLEFE